MGFRLPAVMSTSKRGLKSQGAASKSGQLGVPKGHVAVYVGEDKDDQKQRYLVPLAYLNHPLFKDLLILAEDEYGFTHPMGGLTIPCHQHYFVHLLSQLNSSTSL